MAARKRSEFRRFSGGFNNSTSAFGTAGFSGPGGSRVRGTSGGSGLDGTDSFTTSAADADGTGVWVRPSSGGVLEAYPRTATTATLTTLDNVTTAAYGQHTGGTERRIMYGEGSGGAKDQVTNLNVGGAEGSIHHTFASGEGKRASIITYNNQFLIANGVDAPISIDINSASVTDPINQPRPTIETGVTLVAQDAVGNVKGTVYYHLAEMTGSGDTLAESALSARDALLTIDASINQDGQGDQILITLPDHASYNTKTFRIYRTFANRSAPRYLSEIVVGAAGGSYVDNNADDDLGEEPLLNGDQPPAAITSWIVHKDRVFGLAGNVLYWSDAGSHASWYTATEGNFIEVHKDDGDVGTALARTPEGLLIFKENHIYMLLGDRPDNFRLTDAISTTEGHSIGTPHTQSLTTVPGGVVFYWRNGVYVLSGGTVIKISGPVESQWLDPTVLYPEDEAVGLGYDPRFGHVYVAYNYTTTLKPESCFIFDVNAGQWIGSSQDAASKCYLYDPGTSDREPRFYGLSANGLTVVRRLVRDAFADPAVTVEKSRFAPSGSFFGSNVNTVKRWLYMDFHFTDGTAADNLTITPSIDGTPLSAQTVPLPATPGPKRVNIGQLGRRLTYEFKSAAAQKPWGLFEVEAVYQEFSSRSV